MSFLVVFSVLSPRQSFDTVGLGDVQKTHPEETSYNVPKLGNRPHMEQSQGRSTITKLSG